MQLAIVLPVLNEASLIEAALLRLKELRARGARVIVVDGGSQDDTVARAAPHADRTIVAPRGRSWQMNAGARADEAATADVLLFLHADTQLPVEADRRFREFLATEGIDRDDIGEDRNCNGQAVGSRRKNQCP